MLSRPADVWWNTLSRERPSRFLVDLSRSEHPVEAAVFVVVLANNVDVLANNQETANVLLTASFINEPQAEIGAA
jgi:hypothetical protein